MSAIKSILADFEGDFVSLQKSPREAQKPVNQTQIEIDAASLQPVVEVETKVSAARFSSIPSDHTENAMTRVIAGAMPKRSAAKADGQAVRSGATQPRKADSLDQIVDDVETSEDVTAPKQSVFSKFSFPKPKLAKISGKTSPASFLTAAIIFGFLVWPVTMGFLLLAVAALIVGIFLLVGADRVWGVVIWIVEFFAARFPEKKDAIYDTLDTAALYWDALLDRLPEGLADSLYMPDFANYEDVQTQHDSIVADRLSRMQNQA